MSEPLLGSPNHPHQFNYPTPYQQALNDFKLLLMH